MKRTCLLITASALFAMILVLGLNQPEEAFSQQSRQPFANAVQQRAEANELLKEIRDLLREQNALLQKSLSRPGTPATGAGIR
ncbi:MAG: hypothetical protein MPJ50_15260 [Pirellulales bacterium]|nr:hypothetical protein [Pirellulales bacterium]